NEEHGDELISIQLAEQEKLHKNLEDKKKINRPVYTGYDDDEFVLGKQKSLLSQYDEVLGIESGTEGFVLGKVHRSRQGAESGDGSISNNKGFGGLSAKEIMNKKLKESAITLTYNKTQQAQDYYTKEEAETTFKKSKKKKKSRSRKQDNWEEDESQDENSMDVERPEPVDISDMNFVDDEDLQASLAKARRVATKKTVKTLTPEQIAKNLAESTVMDMDEDDTQQGGLVISDVSEFVSNLSSSAIQLPSARPGQASRTRERSDEAADVSLSSERNHEKEGLEMTEALDDEAADSVEPRIRADSENGEDMDVAIKESTGEEHSIAESALIDEPLVSKGLGSTLALLKQKGAYEMGSAEQADRAKLAREMARDKARDKEKSKDKTYSTRDRERDREYENQRREQLLLDEREARMKHYKPDIKLEYIDESGNRLNTKEAFRQLSHAFHGKTSGKMKTEKRMKKLEDEKRLLGMSSTDTPLNMVSAFQERQKAAGSAHIVLAVGNRKYSTFAAPDQRTQANMSLSGVHAPNREKVTFGLKRKADAAAGAAQEETATKKSRSED
ncbi:hypothetical protein BGZ65_003791, partial [Modicella reniformis]